MEKIDEFLNIRKIFLLTTIGDVIGISGSLNSTSISPLNGFTITNSLFPPANINLLFINTGVNHKLLFSSEISCDISVDHLIFPFFKSRLINSLLLCVKKILLPFTNGVWVVFKYCSHIKFPFFLLMQKIFRLYLQ